jgi:hypothetical protein
MPIVQCTHCGIRQYAAAAYVARPRCLRCDAPLDPPRPAPRAAGEPAGAGAGAARGATKEESRCDS